MTARDHVAGLVQALGADLGLPLRLGSDGQLRLGFGDGMACTLAVDDERDALAGGVGVAAVPRVGAGTLLAAALRLNEGEVATGGGGIGYDEARSELVLWRRCPTSGLDKAALAQFLDGLMEAGLVIRDRLAIVEPAAPSARAQGDGAVPVDLDLLRYLANRG